MSTKKKFKMDTTYRKNLSRLRQAASRYGIAAEEALLSQDQKTAQILLCKQNEAVSEYAKLMLKYCEWMRGGIDATYAK